MTLLTRVADSLLGTGRYLERAENLTRALRVTLHASHESGGREREDLARWNTLLEISGEREGFLTTRGEITGERVLEFLTLATDHPSSVRACVRRARENALAVRDRLSRELWEELNRLYWLLEEAGRGRGEGAGSLPAPGALRECENRFQLLQGLAETTVLRDDGWSFLRCGLLLERALQAVRVARAYVRSEPGAPGGSGSRRADALHWITLLKSCSAYEAYRKTYATFIRPEKALELLVGEERFPRSVRFCVAGLVRELSRIVGPAPETSPYRQVLRLAGRLESHLVYTEAAELFRPDPAAGLSDLAGELGRIGGAFARAALALPGVRSS